MSRKDVSNKDELSNRLDRPSLSVPSVDRPWDNPEERKRRLRAIEGDRAAHRVYSALYEDMLN